MVSEIRKPKVDLRVSAWFGEVDERDLFLSVLIVGEIRQGIERLRSREPQRASKLDAWLTTLKREYDDRVLTISSTVVEEWGRLNAVRPLPVVDGLLAATAAVHGLTLVTRNVVDFEATGVSVFNPFDRA